MSSSIFNCAGWENGALSFSTKHFELNFWTLQVANGTVPVFRDFPKSRDNLWSFENIFTLSSWDRDSRQKSFLKIRKIALHVIFFICFCSIISSQNFRREKILHIFNSMEDYFLFNNKHAKRLACWLAESSPISPK